MENNVQAPTHGVRALLPTLWFTGDDLGAASDMGTGAILFEAPIAFEDLDALDRVIGHLAVARHKIAAERMAAEAARRDSTPERQPRERSVPCAVCGTATWNVEGVCNHDLRADQPQKVGA